MVLSTDRELVIYGGYTRTLQYFRGERLGGVFDKLDDKYLNMLTIPVKKDSAHPHCTAKDQFMAIYGERRLCCSATQQHLAYMETKFITIFEDNILLIEQIGKSREYISHLSELANWESKSNTTNVSQGATEDSNSQLNFGSSNNKTLSTELSTAKNSDNNSYTDEEITSVPINTISKNNSISVGSGGGEEQGGVLGASASTRMDKFFGATISTNDAENMRKFLSLKNRELRKEFWEQFEVLFYRS